MNTKSHTKTLATGLLVLSQRKGRITYDTAVVVRADSPYEKLEDLKGESMAWVDRESASGFIFPAAEIIRRLGPLDEVLSRQHFHGSHRDVCEAVANGWASAGATFAVRDDDGKLVGSGWIELLPDRADEFRSIAFLGPIPGDNVAHRPGLPSNLTEQLIGVLSRLHETDDGKSLLWEMFGAEAFARGDLDLYVPVRDVLKTLEDS